MLHKDTREDDVKHAFSALLKDSATEDLPWIMTSTNCIHLHIKEGKDHVAILTVH